MKPSDTRTIVDRNELEVARRIAALKGIKGEVNYASLNGVSNISFSLYMDVTIVDPSHEDADEDGEVSYRFRISDHSDRHWDGRTLSVDYTDIVERHPDFEVEPGDDEPGMQDDAWMLKTLEA